MIEIVALAKKYNNKQNSTGYTGTFFKCLIDANLSLCKVLITLNIRENSALVYPVIVMGSKEKDWKVTDVVLQALDVGGNQARVADLSGPPSTHGSTSINLITGGPIT